MSCWCRWYFLLHYNSVGAYVPDDHNLGKDARVVYVTGALPLYRLKEASRISRSHPYRQLACDHQQYQLTHSFVSSRTTFQSPCAHWNSSCYTKCLPFSDVIIALRLPVRFLPDGPRLRPIPPLQCHLHLCHHSPGKITSQIQTAHHRGCRDLNGPVLALPGRLPRLKIWV